MAYKNIEDQRAYHKVWYKNNKQRRIIINYRWRDETKLKIDEIKKSGFCADCGVSGKNYPCILDFDHKGNKDFQISHYRDKSWKRVKREIDKCELVCANCHRIRTFISRKNIRNL